MTRRFFDDLMRYDFLPQANEMKMPVLLVVGEKDTATCPDHQEILFSRLSGPKELCRIMGCEHTFKSQFELAVLREFVAVWLGKIGFAESGLYPRRNGGCPDGK